MPRLLEALDSPYPQVRSSAQGNLAEFTFQRFLNAFELLTHETRRSPGAGEEGRSPTLPDSGRSLLRRWRTRRLRGLIVARALELVPEVEEAALSLLNDEDHMVRAEAAAFLAGCTSARSREALLAAHEDRSPLVQEAARESLRQRGEQTVYAEAIS